MRLYTLLFCCLLIPNLFPQDSSPPPSPSPQTPYVEREEKQFNFYPGGKIEISANAPGSVKIIGWQKATVRVEVEKVVYYLSPEQAKAEIQHSPIRVRWTPTSATIVTPVNTAGIEMNLAVYVPCDKTDINAKINHGDFSIERVTGWVEATIVTEGGIEAKSLSGYFSISTLRGDINVVMDGSQWRGLEFAALTHNGSAHLQIPEQYSAALQLETRDGKIVVDYPPQVVDGEPTPPDIMIRKNSQSLKASIGDGGAPIKLVTYSGDISLSKKE
jgi:DUF4097 and DUF4098 domain-containing protein YvlB